MPGKRQPPQTVGKLLYWSYANLAMAHAAVEEGHEKYGRLGYIIRSRLDKGLRTGSMRIGSILDDEKLKMKLPQCCAYCGSTSNLSIDHLIPRKLGGVDSGDNAVWACRSCNSSKGGRDLLVWMRNKQKFPPRLILRRYLKLAIEYGVANGIMDHTLEDPPEVPFALDAIPTWYPAPGELVLWVDAEASPACV